MAQTTEESVVTTIWGNPVHTKYSVSHWLYGHSGNVLGLVVEATMPLMRGPAPYDALISDNAITGKWHKFCTLDDAKQFVEAGVSNA